MATTEYMTSQTYSATIGGVVYNVSASLGAVASAAWPAATAAADDTSPTVLGVNILYLPANTAATVITQLDGGVSNQVVTLICTSSTNSSTITNGGNFLLSASWSPQVNDTLLLTTANGTTWRELARSNN